MCVCVCVYVCVCVCVWLYTIYACIFIIIFICIVTVKNEVRINKLNKYIFNVNCTCVCGTDDLGFYFQINNCMGYGPIYTIWYHPWTIHGHFHNKLFEKERKRRRKKIILKLSVGRGRVERRYNIDFQFHFFRGDLGAARTAPRLAAPACIGLRALKNNMGLPNSTSFLQEEKKNQVVTT